MKKIVVILLSILAAIVLFIMAFIVINKFDLVSDRKAMIPESYKKSVEEKITTIKENGEYVRNFGSGTYTCSTRGGDLQPGTYMFYITARSKYVVVCIDLIRNDQTTRVAYETDNYGPVGFTVEEGDILKVSYGSGYIVKGEF